VLVLMCTKVLSFNFLGEEMGLLICFDMEHCHMAHAHQLLLQDCERDCPELSEGTARKRADICQILFCIKPFLIQKHLSVCTSSQKLIFTYSTAYISLFHVVILTVVAENFISVTSIQNHDRRKHKGHTRFVRVSLPIVSFNYSVKH